LRFNNSLKKIRTAVTFEDTLNLSSFYSGSGREEEGGREGGQEGKGGGGSGSRKRTRSMTSVEGEAMARAAATAATVGGGGGGGGSEGGKGGGSGLSSEYELMSVVIHQGRTRQRGHYFLYQRVLEGVEEGGKEELKGRQKDDMAGMEEGGREGVGGEGKWWLFDDAKRHEEVDASRVLRATDEVYMLVYRQKERGRERGVRQQHQERQQQQQHQHGTSALTAASAAAATTVAAPSFPSSSSSSSTSSTSSSSSTGTSPSVATTDSVASRATTRAAASQREELGHEEDGEGGEGEGGFASSPPTSSGRSARKRGRPRGLTAITDRQTLEWGGRKEGRREG